MAKKCPGIVTPKVSFCESIRANLRNVGVRIAGPLSFGHFLEICVVPTIRGGKLFLLTVGSFLLTVMLLCLQSLKVLIRCTFPL